ncbi:hypothetical protein ACIFOC_00388 [Leucobacter aridicollis]|uniref:ead/Ea22-like family protein n=1 Tax=Leucobacter aridicollis TaxID=283878 RepID=UPI0037CA97B1
MIDLDALQAAAEAATPGPWEAEVDDGEGTTEVNAGSALTTWTEYEDGLRIGSPARSWRTTDRIVERDDLYDEDFEQAAADAEFIAAANPAVILEWAAEYRAALSRIARVEALLTELDDGGKSGVRQSSKSSAAAFAHQRLADAIREALTEGEPDERTN